MEGGVRLDADVMRLTLNNTTKVLLKSLSLFFD